MDMNFETGAIIEGWPAVVQSIEIILNTRINTRVFLREFGSRVPEMVDAPQNDTARLELYMAVAEAIGKWEPRFELTSVQALLSPNGVITLQIAGFYRPNALSGDLSTISDDVNVLRFENGVSEQWRLAA